MFLTSHTVPAVFLLLSFLLMFVRDQAYTPGYFLSFFNFACMYPHCICVLLSREDRTGSVPAVGLFWRKKAVGQGSGMEAWNPGGQWWKERKGTRSKIAQNQGGLAWGSNRYFIVPWAGRCLPGIEHTP